MSAQSQNLNKFLADYAYLAEASYADFSKSSDVKKNLTDLENGNKPNSFATLVTKNYEVMAHYEDRSPNYSFGNISTEIHNKESGFSGTLFMSKN